MNTSVTITKKEKGWQLSIATVQHDGEIKVTVRRFFRLISAIDAANTMGLHIDNLDELPLPQYGVLRESA